jgi:hypothetical protein
MFLSLYPALEVQKAEKSCFHLGRGTARFAFVLQDAVFREHLAMSGDAAKDLRIDLDQFLAQE